MRNAFANSLYDEIKKNKKIILLSGDIGNKLFDKIKKKFPKNFYNCGVAEANMTTVAAGMAFSKLKPVTYTITSFNTLKTIEQIKLDICYPNHNVVIVGVGSGLSYSNLGTTHHSLEDVGILLNIPNLNIICPADPVQLKRLLPQIFKIKGPTYLRIGKKGEKNIYNEKKCKSKIGGIDLIKKGKKICIIGYGNILYGALQAYELIEKDKRPSIYNVHSLKPINSNTIIKILKKYKKIIVLEEHFKIGGLYGLISIISSENKIMANIISMSAGNKFITGAGKIDEIKKKLKLDVESIIKNIKC